MATFNKYNCFVGDLGLKYHDLNADTLKVALVNTAPAAGDTSYAGEVANGNGYTTGGADAQNTYSQTSGTGTLAGTDITWTCVTAAMGPFRYAVLYNSSATAGHQLIGWWDYASEVTLQVGETFVVDFGASILTLA